jgi:hypothetical protein
VGVRKRASDWPQFRLFVFAPVALTAITLPTEGAATRARVTVTLAVVVVTSITLVFFVLFDSGQFVHGPIMHLFDGS